MEEEDDDGTSVSGVWWSQEMMVVAKQQCFSLTQAGGPRPEAAGCKDGFRGRGGASGHI